MRFFGLLAGIGWEAAIGARRGGGGRRLEFALELFLGSIHLGFLLPPLTEREPEADSTDWTVFGCWVTTIVSDRGATASASMTFQAALALSTSVWITGSNSSRARYAYLLL